MVVRFRKDGVLQHVTTVPAKFRTSIASRLKIMANLDISERRHPQDGRVDLRVENTPIDLRVASLPTVFGESIVLRVLDKSNAKPELAKLDFLPEQLEKLRHCLAQPYGCLLVVGPAGSGTTTTLYGAISEISSIERKIITVEDPVEHRLEGITQVQTHFKTGLTFAAALGSVLQCDPDVVMIGELQDEDTAAIGVKAALTGHLVLSALHSNTAPGAFARLAELGVDPHLVSSAVLGVLAQRLARRLCGCAEVYTPTREQVFEAGFPRWALDQFDEEPFTLRRPTGCERCANRGYLGRVGIHEVMLMSQEIAQLAVAQASPEDIAAIAKQQGMLDLWDDGIRKVILGHTTIEELRRVVQH
jgi:type II secretory ATPase GspE/PulE/Tfp pilus assembly ATPase PilB-like protein